VTSAIEHKAVLDSCRHLEEHGFEVTRIVPRPDGLITPALVEAALRDDTVLLSLMHVNNEIGGTITDIESIGRLARDRGIPFHVDAAQSVARIPLDVRRQHADFVSLSGHKMYGPQGHRRSLAASLIAKRRDQDTAHTRNLERRFLDHLQDIEQLAVNGDRTHCVPGIVNLRFASVESESLMVALPDVAFSTGSAWHVGAGRAVVRAARARSGRRFGPRFAAFQLRPVHDRDADRLRRGAHPGRGRRAAVALIRMARSLRLRSPGTGSPGRRRSRRTTSSSAVPARLAAVRETMHAEFTRDHTDPWIVAYSPGGEGLHAPAPVGMGDRRRRPGRRTAAPDLHRLQRHAGRITPGHPPIWAWIGGMSRGAQHAVSADGHPVLGEHGVPPVARADGAR